MRGRDIAGVIEQYTKFVKPAFDTFVAPSRKHADVIIPWGRLAGMPHRPPPCCSAVHGFMWRVIAQSDLSVSHTTRSMLGCGASNRTCPWGDHDMGP